MSAPVYDSVKSLHDLGLHSLAWAVEANNEVTLHTPKGVFAIYKAAACVNAVDRGEGVRIALGHPMGGQLLFSPAEIRIRFGVSQSPSIPGLTYERLR